MSALSAQSYVGSVAPVGTTGGMTVRARGFSNTGDRVYISRLVDLGGSTRDAYAGTWSGLSSTTTLTFFLSWSAQSGFAAAYLSNLSGATATTNHGSVTSGIIGNATTYEGTTGTTFFFAQSPTFDLLRLYGRQSGARLESLVFTQSGAATTLVSAGSPLSIGNTAQFWSVDATRDFVVEGTMSFAFSEATCSGENCRFELGFATAPVTPVPEPAPLLLVATGGAALAVHARRRSRERGTDAAVTG